MDTDPDADRRDRMVDWLASHPDLPHLFARLSELVHALGYAPEELVVIPRSEIDRRETTAFTSGWAEAVSDELPRIRREYERRVADAYAQGQGDGRGVGRQQRRGATGPQDGAQVIALPFARLLEPPAAVVEAEERVRRERELFEQGPVPEPEPDTGYGDEPEPEHGKEPAPDATAPDPLVTAQESRARRTAQPVRKVVRGKGGRPIVPPLSHVPVQQGGAAGERRDPEPRRARRLSERAKALEEELAAERTQEAPPESAP
ncbi:hypothetical protein SNE510_25900 [Streptomyces sp. NE5-10]|uniref:hypothetical protein n=1 Tax=Streptomyces sp. NE5-10 TaxID=2759674 RepID=UPI001903A9F0|nr:hypothetical protein [Streptomyces sp. NE5-10]GHJ93071.1 hypothetical protein SNE510_25900 [Streptomyces sp. NE5-10]